MIDTLRSLASLFAFAYVYLVGAEYGEAWCRTLARLVRRACIDTFGRHVV